MGGGPREKVSDPCADIGDRAKRAAWKRWAVLICGWAFVLLGVAGLVLPILQGFLFIAVGLLILSRESVWACRQLEKLKKRYPKLAQTSEEAQKYLARLGQRIRRMFGGAA
jgi:hypothetical protein